ncbi:MAG: T9SS type A sorting domain-containing protein [Candidatus Latescibacteria bacterium]|nr:T9SS type A sorting domain-containing protein [Candidatus Latescibacterota bacterium]
MKAVLRLSIVLLMCGCGAQDPTSSTDVATHTPAKTVALSDGKLSSSVGVLPKAYRLSQNYPNPFNSSTAITYSLPEVSHVRLVIYNGSGRTVRTLVDEVLRAGFYQVIWDAKDDMGWSVASGVYLYRLEAGDFAAARKMALVQ